jgi:hypothetical protein
MQLVRFEIMVVQHPVARDRLVCGCANVFCSLWRAPPNDISAFHFERGGLKFHVLNDYMHERRRVGGLRRQRERELRDYRPLERFSLAQTHVSKQGKIKHSHLRLGFRK